MRQVLVILAALATLLLGSTAMAGEISPDLAAQLAATAPDTPVSVIVHLTEQAPVVQLVAELDQTRATLQQRHGVIVTALQDAARSQQPLLADLADGQRDGGVLGFTSYWISNLIVVKALPSEVERIAARLDVDWVEPNFTAELIKPVSERPLPNDAEAEEGTRGIGMTPGIRAINAPQVWRQLGIDGTGALIGSCDTGVAGNHPALISRWRGTGAPWQECWLDVLGTGTTFPTDTHGHGTHTTGTMCGLAPDDTIGVAPGAQWIASNVINQGTGTAFDNDVIASFQWFADPDGNPFTVDDVPDVVQNSWGVNEGFAGYSDCDSRWWAAIDNCEAAGVVTIWSAGNEGSGAGTLRSPSDRAATLYSSFSVGAVDATNYSFPYPIAGFSSRGPTTCPLVPPLLAFKPEVSAPGVSVYSSIPSGWGYMDGTSMAGPHVSGVVALIRQANPNLSVDLVKQILMNSARDEGTVGEDNTYGWGVIDALAAVQAAMTGFGTLSGVVTNASYNDLPLAGAEIRVPALGFRFFSGANGSYSGSLAPGTHEIVVSLAGFAPQTHTVTVAADGQAVLDIALVDVAGPAITGVSQPLATPDTQGPYTIAAQIADPSTVTSATLHVRVSAGGWQDLPMTGTGDTFAAAIAGAPANTSIAYYLTAVDGAGFTSTDPAGAPTVTYALVVTESAYTQDAESDGTPAWQLGAAGDAADAGLWVRADPVGTIYNGAPMQTEDDHTPAPGVACYVTGNGVPGGAFGDADVDHGCTTLITPTFDLAGFDRAFVTYWRWYGEGGLSTDDDFVVQASNDGGATWVALETVPTSQASWQRVAVELGSLDGGAFALTNQVMVRFLACDLNTQGLVEVAIDDFTIETFTEEHSTAVDDEIVAAPTLRLAPNQPNPFNPSTTIAFSLPRASDVELAVYTLDGRRVAVLVDGTLPAGPHTATWTGRDDGGRQVASGTYFYRLTTGEETLTRRMVLLK
jgi:subtilisin family serine protease